MIELQKNRMELAVEVLRAAYLSENSSGTRASAAFDAGYLYTLAALDAPAEGEHPSPGVLKVATESLGLHGVGIRSAMTYFNLQYSDTGPGVLLPRLLIWVQEMKLLAQRRWGAP